MSFRPLHDRVLVRRVDEDEKTSGGIIIPDTAKEKPSQGEVVSVGPVKEMITGIELLSMLKKVTRSYLENGLVQK